MQPRHSRKWIVWTLVSIALVAVAAACIALGPLELAWRDRDRNVIRLAWDSDANRLVVNEKVLAPLQRDGPYVRRLPGGRIEIMRTVQQGDRYVPERTTLRGGRGTTVDVVVDDARRTRFAVTLREPAAPPPAIWPSPSRMLLLSDLEGDFDAFVALLGSQGVIDHSLHWSFGDGHLVLAGDFVDRGENVVPLLWLIYRLEAEAERAGGRVHYVLGNHELLALAGRFGAAPQRLFASRDAFFGGDNRRVFAADTVLGQWLRTRNVIERIGDTLVVHGGVSETFLRAALDIDRANRIARSALGVDRDRLGIEAKPVLGKHGLPWQYVTVPGSQGEDGHDAPLDAALSRYGAHRLAVGHTTAPRVMLARDGRLLLLDVDHRSQEPEAALFESGRWWRVTALGDRSNL